MIPMLRSRSSGVVARHDKSPNIVHRLPAVVREGPVGLGHPVRFFRFLTAAPRFLAASMNSPASRSTMVFSPRARC